MEFKSLVDVAFNGCNCDDSDESLSMNSPYESNAHSCASLFDGSWYILDHSLTSVSESTASESDSEASMFINN